MFTRLCFLRFLRLGAALLMVFLLSFTGWRVNASAAQGNWLTRLKNAPAAVWAAVFQTNTESVSKSGVAGATPPSGNGTTTINWTINYDLTSSGNAPLANVTLNDTWNSGQTLITNSVQTPGSNWTSSQPNSTALNFTNALLAKNAKGVAQAFPRPLSGNINLSGTGDGFNPAVTANGKVIGINHHVNPAQVWCYDLNTSAPCTGYPKSSGIQTGTNNYTIAIGNRVYMNPDSYDQQCCGAPGLDRIYCWDATTDSTCGQSAATTGKSAVLTVASGKLFTLNQSGELRCFDPDNSLNNCAGFTPVNLGMPARGGAGQWDAFGDDIFAVGSRLYIANYQRKLTCFDVATNTTCSGWPALPTVLTPTTPASEGSNLFPRLSPGGAITGICIAGRNTNATCYDLDSSNPTVVNLGGVHGMRTGINANADVYLGSRVFFPNYNDFNKLSCFDWATSAPCTGAGFTSGFTADASRPYGLGTDGVSVYSYGDSAVLKSWNPISGISPSTRAATTATVNIDSFYCGSASTVAATWDKVILSDINLTSGVEFTSLQVSLINVDSGATVFGPVEAVGGSGIIDISSVSSSFRNLRLQVDETPVATVAWDDNIPPKATLTFTNNTPVQFCYQTQVTCAGSAVSYTDTINTNLDAHSAMASVLACAASPSLTLAQSAPSPSLVAGTNSTYTLTVTNNGSAAATTATVKNGLPIGLDLVSATGTNWTCTPSGATATPVGTITCTFSGGTIATGGGTSTISVVVKPTAPYGGNTVINYASVDPSGGTNAPTPTTCTAANTPAGCAAPVSSAIPASPNLSVSKSSPTLVLNQDATYTITVTNNGNAGATTATVKDALPVGMKLVSASGSGWTCNPTSSNSPVGTIICTFSGSIATGGGTSTISIVACPTTSGTFTNKVSVEPAGGTGAPDPTTCTAANTPSAGCGTPVSNTIANAPPTVASDAGSKLFIARYGNQNRIARANVDGSGLNANYFVVTGNPIGVTVDAVSGKLFWSQYAAGKIGCANLDGSHANSDFITGLNNPLGLTIDAVNRKIYWAEDSGSRIASANLDGTGITTLVSAGSAYDVALDVPNNKLYYCRFSSGLIGRADLDGSNNNASFINTGSTGFGIYGLGLDLVNSKIYWASYGTKTVGCANLNGTGINNSLVTLSGDGPSDVTVDPLSGKVYWSQTGSVGRANLDGTSANETFLAGLGATWGIALGDQDNEGALATRTGTYSDPDGNTVTLSANIGTIQKDVPSAGKWTWTYTPSDGPVPHNVTITANDGNGGTSTTSFTVNVNNIAPTIALSGAASVPVNTSYMLNLGAITDPGTDTVTSYSINWGDGNTENFSGNPASTIKTHTYTSSGSKTITVSLTDEDGTFTSAGTTTVAVTIPLTTIGFHTASGLVGNYYNGGTDAAGNSGPNVGVAFPTSTAGSGKIGEIALANVPSGFTGAFSCNYIGVSVGFGLSVWSGPNATGTMLGSKSYDVNGDGTAFITFSGVAQSVALGKYSGSPSYDNFTFGSATVGTPVAEPPGMTTNAATSVGPTTAVLNALVNPGGATTTAQFEYGTTMSYGSTASFTLSPNDGTTAQTVSANLMGLMPGMTYHFRVTGTNSVGSRQGSNLMFTTPVQAAVTGLTGGSLFRPTNESFTVGYEFTVSQPVTVTSLGFYDEANDGLVTAHNVGIFNLCGTLLASGSVASGTTATLNNGYRYVSISPIVLGAGTYRIGAVIFNGGSNDRFLQGVTTVSTDPLITYVRGYEHHGNTLAFPEEAATVTGFAEKCCFGPNFIFTPGGTPPGAPLANVKGNGVSITDGDTMPDTGDHTNFGDVSYTGSTVTRTFTIENTGTASLTVTGITKSGTHAAEFTLGGLPTFPTTIAVNSSTTFTVTFDPSAVGLRTATISIANDDCPRNPYDFAIQGTGTNAAPTAINGPLLITEDFNYGNSAGTLSGNGGTGFSSAWTGGSYTPTSLSFSNLDTVGGAWNGGSGSRNFSASLLAAGPITGDFLFRRPVAGPVQMFGLGGFNNQGYTIALAPSNDSNGGTVPVVALQGGASFVNLTPSALDPNTTYMYRFAYANSSITVWILTAAQYDNFAPNGLLAADLNAASIGSGATQVTGRGTSTGNVVSNMANLFTYTFGGSGVIMDRLRMSAIPVGATLSIAENAVVNTTVGTLSATDPDPGDTHSFTLVSGTGSTDNNSFTITGNTLKSNAVFDYETKNSYSIRVRVTDSGGLTYETPLTVTINNVNETPTDLALNPTSIAENNAPEATVGTLSATDTDTGDTHTFTLVSGTGSTDNNSFTITGNALKLRPSADFEMKSSYALRVRATDVGGLFFEKELTVTITDVPEEFAPTITRSNAAVTVNEGSIAANSGTFSDANGNNTVTLSASLGAVTKDDTLGTWSWTYTAPDGPDGPTTVTITANDGVSPAVTTTFTLTINNVAPKLNTCGPPSFTLVNTTIGGWAAAPADLDGDGDQDIVMGYPGGGISPVPFRNNGNGTFTQMPTLPGSARVVLTPLIADYNGDGKLDIAVDQGNSYRLYYGDGALGSSSSISVSSGGAEASGAVGDLNGDGKPDFVIGINRGNGDNNGQVTVRLNNGSGGFPSQTQYFVGPGEIFVTLADFNGDGKLDIAAADSEANTVTTLLNNGSGVFTSAGSVNVGTAPKQLAAGDFNNDGKQDLAVPNSGSNNVSILLGNGAGGFVAAVNYAAGTGAKFVLAADFNNDGVLDLGVGLTNGVALLGATGGGTFGSPTVYGTSQVINITLADMNADGGQDILVGFSDLVRYLQANVAPTTVTVNEGATATNSGTFCDPGADTVTITASVGTITQNSGAGTWSWSYATNDGPAQNQTVTITATDSDGATTTYSFNLVVNNLNPTATLANGGAVNEGSTGTVSFTSPADASTTDVSAGFRYAYDFDNDGTFDSGDGTYAGSGTSTSATVPASFLSDGNGTRVVKGRILDKDGGFTDYTTTITINNVTPTIALTGNNSVNVNALYTLNLGGITDPGTDTVINYSINWGDGTTEPFSGNPANTSKTHTYTTSGSKTITISLTDEDSTVANAGTKTITVLALPTITAGATATRKQGSAGTTATIATVNDTETLKQNLVVTVMSAPAGINIASISAPNATTGEVTATVSADCTATLGDNTVVLKVTDGDGLTATANFIVNVTANDPPTVGTYAASSVALGGTVIVTPNAAPADNGTIASVTATASLGFTGTLSGDSSTGAVTVTNSGPAGTYTITVTVTDNCNATVTKTFSLMVDMCAPAPSNLGLWYRAEGNGNAFVGGVNAATASTTNSGLANPTSPTYATGKVGQAWSFNGTTDVLDSGATAILNTFPVTIEAWVNPALRNDAGTSNLSGLVYPNNVISNDKSGFYGHGFGVNVTPDGSQFTIEYNDGFRVVPQANASFTAGQWYHIVVVYGLTGNQGSFKAYVNGVLVDQLTYGQGTVDGLSLIRLGYHNNDNGYGTRRFFKGLLDEVSIYQGCALQLADIQALYQAGAAGKCLSPLNLNIPPTITAAGTQLRARGSSAISQIATVNDTETVAGNLTVAVQSAPTGITVTNIQNNNGAITAIVAADCTATLGNNTVVLYVSDGACATPFANLIVNVTANTAPTVGNYANSGVAASGTVTVTPDAAPVDNGTIASVTATASPNTFTGMFSTNTATGAVTVTNAGPSGTYTITVTVTDNCGATVQKAFTLTVNTAPTINAVAATRQQGVPASNSTIANVSDLDQAAGTLLLKVNGNGTATVNGVTVSNLLNTNGVITADIMADCAAPLGNASFTLTVLDSSNAMSTAMLTVNVTANTPPTLGNYANTGPINVGANTTVTPSAAPADNVAVVSASASAANFTGTFAVDQSSGVLTITNAGPPGTYTVNVKVTDNCGEMTIKSFQLVVNGAPTVTPGTALTRQQGTAASNSTLAALGDDLTAASSLTVALVSAPAGLSVTNLINNNGTVTAHVAADCALLVGPQSFVIKATDAGGLETQATINVTVTANTEPILSYLGQTATAGQPLTVNPATPPSDNGAVSTIALQSKGTFTGTVSVDNSTGVVTLGNANPTGTHTIMIRVTDNCGLFKDASFTVAIGCPLITVGPSVIAAATTGESYVQPFSQTGGIGTTTFSISVGTLPAGLTLNPTTGELSGTPTQTGSFPLTIRATDSNQCFGETQYTLVVNCPVVTFTPNSVNTRTALPAAVASQAYSQTFSVTPARNYNFSISAGTLPNGLTLSAAGVLSGAPLQTGTFNFTVKAKDQYNCESTHDYALAVGCQTFAINPTTLPGGQAGVPYQQSLTTIGSLGVVTFSLNSGALPPGLSLVNGAITGTPTTLGSFTFELKATDGNGCPAFRTYNNVPITCPTFALSGLPAATAGVAYNQSLSVTPNIGGPHVYSFTGTLPPGLSLSSAGVLSGTPTTAGTYNFTVNVRGSNSFSGCAGSKAYSLAVNCQTITLTASLPGGIQGAAYNQTVTASPAASGAYSYAVVSNTLPPGLSLNSATGAITGIPTAAGNYTFSIRATRWGTCTGTQSYNVTITGTCSTLTVNPATLPNPALGVAYSQTLSATGGTGPYTFAITQGSLPAGLSLSSSGALSGTATVSGTFSFRVTATGQGGCTGSRTYVITLGCPTMIFSPVAMALPHGTMGLAYTQTISVTPANNFTFSILLGQLPHGFTLNAQTGVISGISDQTGLFNFTIKALGGSCQATKAYTISVRANAAALAQMNDYDGDGKSDLAVFRPSDGTWYIKHSSDGSVQAKVWGISTDVPVPGDYDGDGKTDVAVWRGAQGVWYIWRSSDQQYEAATWGAGLAPFNDLPVPADYDGDGRTDLAVFRRNLTAGVWYIRLTGGSGLLIKQWGVATDVPVVSDYDGDGKTDLAVWSRQNGNWSILLSSTGTTRTQVWGAGYAPYYDQALPGDYDGDGQADLAVWRAGSATWYLLLSAQETATATRVVGQGLTGDAPVSQPRP